MIQVVRSEASLVETSRLMRERGAMQVAVIAEVDGKARTVGIVTARDIVTRVVALGLDPEVLTAGDIASFD